MHGVQVISRWRIEEARGSCPIWILDWFILTFVILSIALIIIIPSIVSTTLSSTKLTL